MHYLLLILTILLALKSVHSADPLCPHGQTYSITEAKCVGCFYACDSCFANDYLSCTVCKPGRGNGGIPVSGMCYC